MGCFTPGSLSGQNEDTNLKRYITSVFLGLFTAAETWKQPKCPSADSWIKKTWHMYVIGYYSGIENSEILPFVAMWMNLENTMLSEISHTEKDKYSMISLVCIV